jgi:methionyl aminopeptidase
MIALRNEEEIDAIRKAGSILHSTLKALEKSVAPGVSTIELDGIARKEIIGRDGYPAFKGYRGFPGNICTSINEVVVHGIPSSRKLKEGDIISIDVGVRFRDYLADGAITLPVGRISDTASRLIDVTRLSLSRGIEQAVAGRRLSDISAAVQECVEAGGFSVVRDLVGHGIGRELWEKPEIPNFGKPGCGPVLEAGMVLAIEPMVNAGTYEVETLEDGWAVATADRKLSAHFEHTIVVREGKAEIMTAG